jgi:hypothetical protein
MKSRRIINKSVMKSAASFHKGVRFSGSTHSTKDTIVEEEYAIAAPLFSVMLTGSILNMEKYQV